MDAQPVAGVGVDNRARHARVVHRLIHVGGNDLVRLRNGVSRVKVFAVDDGGESARVYLGSGDDSALVPHVPHAVPSVRARRGRFRFRAHRVVARDLLDLEIDVACPHRGLPPQSCATSSLPSVIGQTDHHRTG